MGYFIFAASLILDSLPLWFMGEFTLSYSSFLQHMSETDHQQPEPNLEDVIGADDDGIDLSEQLEAADNQPTADSDDNIEIVEAMLENDAEESAPELEMSATQEIEKWKEIAARSQADLENYRKRMAREKTEAIQYGNASLLSSLLPVLDNFEMGLKAAENEDPNSIIYQGMVMVQKQMVDFLSENRVEQIDVTEGADFNPNIHEAIKQEPSETVEEGKIIFAMRKGFKLSDRLLRPANVVVSSGQPTEEQENA